MITKDKLDIFKKYHGDGDMFIRDANKETKNMIDYNDWSIIDSLIQDIRLVDKKLVSQDFEQRVLADIKLKVDKEAIEYLYQLVLKTNI